MNGVKPHRCVSPPKWNYVKCGKPDAAALTNQVWIARSYTQKYPGTNKALKRTLVKCKRLAKKKERVRTWFIPGKKAWNRGNKFGYCEFD